MRYYFPTLFRALNPLEEIKLERNQVRIITANELGIRHKEEKELRLKENKRKLRGKRTADRKGINEIHYQHNFVSNSTWSSS